MKVRVYYNLRSKLWSVQDARTRRVIGHASSVLLDKVQFQVSQAGRERVLREQVKNVHAFVVGELVSATWFTLFTDAGSLPPDGLWMAGYASACYLAEDRGEGVSYNPYKAGTFVLRETDEPITEARRAYLNPARRVYAVI